MSKSVIGVDLGGTKLAAARYDVGKWLLKEKRQIGTHASKKFPHVVEDVCVMIDELICKDTVGIGIGVPGLVRQPEGSIVTLPNIPDAEGFELQSIVQSRFDIRVMADNDANCFALAEAIHGSGKGHRVVVGVTMGTGVGGGIIIDGSIYHGHAGFAAEIGHMLLMPGQPPYSTSDARGDIEQFFSGTAMGKRCREAKRPEDYLEGEVCAFLQPSVFREVAWMCVNLTHLLDPSVIVFGGSAGRALEPHIRDVLKELQQWLLPGTPLPEIRIAMLPDAETRGAALLLSSQ